MFKTTDILRFTGASVEGLRNGYLCEPIGHIFTPDGIVYQVNSLETGLTFHIHEKYLTVLASEVPTTEMVNHPAHYNNGKYEVIDVIEDWKLCYNLGNAVKYIGRSAHKGKEIEDLEKAVYSIQRQIDLLTHG